MTATIHTPNHDTNPPQLAESWIPAPEPGMVPDQAQPAVEAATVADAQFRRPTLPAPVVGSGQRLATALAAALRDVPDAAIIEEWASRGVPSAIPEAFFLYPTDLAVPYFEEAICRVEDLDSATPKVVQFFKKCRSRALSYLIAQSVEDLGTEATIEQVRKGLSGDEAATTALIEAIQG